MNLQQRHQRTPAQRLERAHRDTFKRRPRTTSHATRTDDRAACDLAGFLRRSAIGDQDALAALYDATAPRLFGLALRVLKDKSRAEDVTEDAYLEIWQSSARFDPRRISATTWMVSIVHRHAAERIRTDAATGTTGRPDDGPGPARTARGRDTLPVDNTGTAPVRGETACPGLERLSPSQREALEMTYFDGYTHSQLAEATGVSPAVVAARLREGLILLLGPASDRWA